MTLLSAQWEVTLSLLEEKWHSREKSAKGAKLIPLK